MTFKIFQLEALYRGIKFMTPRYARSHGFCVNFRVFSLQIILLSKTILIEV